MWLTKHKSKLLLVLTTVFFIFALLFGIASQSNSLVSHDIKRLATTTNPNLSIESISMPSLLRCKWWNKQENESEDAAIKKAKFIKTDCSNYFPNSFAKRFFIYFNNIQSISGTGVVVKAQGSDKYIIPSIVEATSVEAYNILDAIQKNLQSNQKNTPITLFQKIPSSLNNQIVMVFELPKQTKIEAVYLGALRRNKKITIVNNINYIGVNSKNLKLTIGYVLPNDNVVRLINHVDTPNNKINRFFTFLNKPYSNNNTTIDSTFSFLANFTQSEWNKKVFPKNLISIASCVKHIEEDLKITHFDKVAKFCEYLNNVYSTQEFYESNDFVFNPSKTQSFLGDFINPIIDGAFPLASLPWDLIYFPHKKAIFKDFNLIAMGDIFLQKLITNYVNRNDDFKVVDLTLKNLNLNENTIKSFLLPLFQKGQLEILDFSNNQVPIETLKIFLKQPNLKKLVLINNFFNTNILDLRNLTLLEDLKIQASSISIIKLNSSALKRIVLNNVGVNSINGLNLTNNIELLNLDNNNLELVNLAPQVRIKKLSVKNNRIKSFSLSNQQEVEILDLSMNQIKSLLFVPNLPLKELYLTNNLLETLILHSDTLEKLVLNNNKLKSLDIGTTSLEYANFSGNVNIQHLLNNINFVAPKLKVLNLSDTELTSFNSAWIGTNDNLLDLILANVNQNPNDDNNITSISISTLPKLQSLSLANIHLNSITIKNASFLKALNISNNEINNIEYQGGPLESLNIANLIPNNKIFNLVKKESVSLKNLNISGTTSNWGSVFENVSFPELEELNASHNNFLEVPSYFVILKAQIRVLDFSHNKLRNRFDAFGYLKLEKLDLSNNSNVLAIINLDGAPLLNTLNVSYIPKVIDRITKGNHNLKILDISNTQTRIVRDLKVLFPNVNSIDISNNKIEDLFELVGSKTTTIKTNLDITNEIINELPTVQDIFYFNSTFNLLNFVNDLVISFNVYVIHLDPDKIVLQGNMNLLNRWFNELLGKRVYLVDRNNDLVSLNKTLIQKYFHDFQTQYKLTAPIPKEHLNHFNKISPILDIKDLNSIKKNINLYLMSLYPEIVSKYKSRIAEYKNSTIFKSKSANDNLTNFKYTLYSLLASIIVMGIIITMVVTWLLRKRK